ncbi:hypothetical protein D9757_008723 [Collybiopsis confluens]|uniref:Heme haloperoxidase family profile domain-containing protein n=1 Tax=Collybiopsis confluens TaxID=2823264 RepID=A0A8H5H8X2_9AGAR|nr:hypothetical protein D9757_008723 [Collybiopsis confluens]
MNLLFLSFLASALAVGVQGHSGQSEDHGHSGHGSSDPFNHAGGVDWNLHKWEKPGPNDSRGPCPGLNTLANHGFLPRNGKNITVQNILDAVNDGFNFRPIDIMVVAAKVALLSTDNVNYVTLEESALYGNIEHDTSLSRSDYALGDNIHFDETIYQTLASSNPGVDYYNITSAAQVVEQRLIDDKIVNPGLINTIKEITFRTRESAFYLSTMGNVTAGTAPKKFVDILFREERLPLQEGWRPSPVPIDDSNFPALQSAVFNATKWEPSGKVICPWIRDQPEGPVFFF